MSSESNSTHRIPPHRPRIKIVFKGFLMTHIRHGEELALVGALADSPCHRPIVHVYKIDRDHVTTEIAGLDIDVEMDFCMTVNPVSTGIQVFQKDDEEFNRLDDYENDKRDFRWFVDLDRLHEIPVLLNLNKLHPKFWLNQALFHVSDMSDEAVRIKRHGVGRPRKRFGRFGLEITARVDFDPIASGAVLKNGETTILPRDDDPHYDYRYEIVFDCTCRPSSEETSDYYLVYGNDVITDEHGEHIDGTFQVELSPASTQETMETADKSQNQKIEQQVGLFTLTPEVYCTGGNC